MSDELACRCATFINCCLYSDCEVVSFAARRGVYYSRMLSQLDVTLCFAAHGLMSLSDIACINKSFVWARRRSHLTAQCLSTVSLLLELLFVKLEYFSVPCLSQDEVSYAIHVLYVPIDFIFYLIVFFIVLTTVPCVRFI